MIIELDIFCLEAEQLEAQEIGISIPFEDCVLRKFAFNTIDFFYPRTDYPQYTVISSSNQQFTTNTHYEALKLKMEIGFPYKMN